MAYSLEYKEWTGENVEVDFSIKEVSGNLPPDGETEVTCDGIGLIGLLKDSEGQLKVKMKPVNGEPSEIVSYFDILAKYKIFEPTTPVEEN